MDVFWAHSDFVFVCLLKNCLSETERDQCSEVQKQSKFSQTENISSNGKEEKQKRKEEKCMTNRLSPHNKYLQVIIQNKIVLYNNIYFFETT